MSLIINCLVVIVMLLILTGSGGITKNGYNSHEMWQTKAYHSFEMVTVLLEYLADKNELYIAI